VTTETGNSPCHPRVKKRFPVFSLACFELEGAEGVFEKPTVL
jgi:hypothetical protein